MDQCTILTHLGLYVCVITYFKNVIGVLVNHNKQLGIQVHPWLCVCVCLCVHVCVATCVSVDKKIKIKNKNFSITSDNLFASS